MRNQSLFLLFPRGKIARREIIGPNVVFSHCFSTFSFQRFPNKKKTVVKSKEHLPQSQPQQQEPKVEEDAEFVDESDDVLNSVEVIDFRKKSSGNAKDMKVFQQSIDKLARKYETLSKNVSSLQETVAIMSSSVQMLSETHINQKVKGIIKNYKLLSEGDAKTNPFVRVNSLSRLEAYLNSFVSGSNVPGVEQAIKDTVSKQMFVGLDGIPFAYQQAAQASSPWITGLLNTAKGGRAKSMISGEVTMVGSFANITRALHRAIRYPLLIKRYTLRVQKALFKVTNEQALNEPMEHMTLFVVMGSLFSPSIPAKYMNRVLNNRDIQSLEDDILNSFEGEVYIPSDEEIISKYIFSDPSKDSIGVWSVFLNAQLNGKTLSQLRDSETGIFAENDRDKFLMLIMLRLMVLYKMDLFLASCNNPLP